MPGQPGPASGRPSYVMSPGISFSQGESAEIRPPRPLAGHFPPFSPGKFLPLTRGSAAKGALTDPDKTAKVVVRRPSSGAWRRQVGRRFSKTVAVAVSSARGRIVFGNLARAGVRFGLAALVLLIAGNALQNASAEGDTRTLTMHHVHTGETITVTYKRDGEYDEAALKKLDWFMRDWRRNEETRMDPHLFDIMWQAYRETGATKPIEIICGYRSPNTNALLRARSGGVAEYSQHILGKAIDFFIPDVSLAKLRAIGLQMQRGGVGFYPRSGSPFVHLDVGTVRHWPGISREQLVKIFPHGRTVHIPRDGQPLPGYAQALAEIERRGNVPNAHSLKLARAAGAITEHDEQVAELIAQDRQQTLVALVNSGGDNGIAKGQEAPLTLASLKPIKPTPKKPRMQVASAGPVPLPQVRPTFVTLASVELKPLAAPVTTASAAGNVFDRRFWPGPIQNESRIV